MNAPDAFLDLDRLISQHADRLNDKVIAWRRDLHANPELGNSEFRTGQLVAAHLRALGLDDVRDQVAYTGVVGVLKGGQPGPCVALRADRVFARAGLAQHLAGLGVPYEPLTDFVAMAAVL